MRYHVIEKLRSQLSRDEGRIAHVYFDTLGYATIGVGHLVDERRGGKLPEHIIDLLLDWDIEEHEKELVKALPWVNTLDDARKGVLVNMAFNLGVAGLLKFKLTLAAVEAGRYGEAAHQMMQSTWATQVGSRADRLAKQMETGQWI
jgi:lysozyme